MPFLELPTLDQSLGHALAWSFFLVQVEVRWKAAQMYTDKHLHVDCPFRWKFQGKIR